MQTKQRPNSINWKSNAVLLLLGLALSALTSVVEVAKAAKPPPWIPSQAVSDYIDFPGVASHLVHQVPGDVAGGPTIVWGLTSEGKGAQIQLFNYPMGTNVRIDLIQNRDGQVVAVRVGGQGGPPGGPWPYHDTDIIPCTPVAFDLVNGFTIHVHVDNIQVYRHSTNKPNSPRVGVAGLMSLGDLVIYPKP